MYGGSGKYNFQIGVQNNVNNAFEITPSTAVNGTTFSTPAVVLDSSGNLGLGVTPSAWGIGKALQVNNASLMGYLNRLYASANTYFDGTGTGKYIATDYATSYQQLNGQHLFFTAPSGTAGNAITFTQAMTLEGTDRTNLIIGATSSGDSTASRGVIHLAGTSSAILSLYTGSTRRGYLYTQGTDIIASAETGNFTIQTGSANPIVFYTNGTERMRIDSSGNVGIGTTSPSAKLDVRGSSSSTSVMVGAYIYNENNGTNSQSGIGFFNYDNFSAKIYSPRSGSSAGTLVFATNGGGGIAESNVTERARITSTGLLQINGDNGFTSGIKLSAVADTGGNGSFVFKNDAGNSQWTGWVWNAGTTGDNLLIQFLTEAGGTGRGSITYNRGAGVLAYNVTSDYRAKNINGPITNSGALIDSVPVYMGKMKDATQERPMFIAHETPDYAHTGEKDAVDADGNPVYQQMDTSTLVPVMWAEIQSLRKRLTALEST
jgi:hypothetical protein